MRIKSLRIRNFTSLVNIEVSNLPNLVVLIGKNSSGKSNVIDALARLLTEPARQLGNIDDYYYLFPNHDTNIAPSPEIAATLTLSAADWDRFSVLGPEVCRQLEDTEIHLAKQLTNVGGIAHWSIRSVSVDKTDYVVDTEIVIPEVAIGLMEVDGVEERFYRISTESFLSRLEETTKAGFRSLRTTENARTWNDRFSERPPIIGDKSVRILWDQSQSRGHKRHPWTRVVQEYSKIAPNQQRPAGVASSIHLDEGPLSVSIGMTGEGSQATLRLIAQLEDALEVVAIEEPETHLHPGMIKRVGELLAAKAESGNQIFVCTHSPFLVEKSSLDNFLVVKKESIGTTVSSIGDTEGLRSMLFDIGMRPSDILFSNAILLVEGLSDELFFGGLSNKIETPLAETYVKFIRAGGYPRGRHKIEFWTEVGREAGLPVYLILDKNAESEADRAVKSNLITREQFIVLQNGNLEDCYPWEVLENALSKVFGVTMETPIAVGNRVAELKKELSGKTNGDGWKIDLAEEIARTITKEQINSEMTALAEFIRKVHREVSVR